jgi:hypothetical protein
VVAAAGRGQWWRPQSFALSWPGFGAKSALLLPRRQGPCHAGVNIG